MAAKASRPPRAGAGGRGSGTVAFLARWINYLCEGQHGWVPVTAENLFRDLSNGLVLCRLVERLVPGADFSKGLYLKPATKKSCVVNLEKALSHAWRQGVHAAQMCTAEDFVQAQDRQAGAARQAVVRCMVELFEALQMRQRDARARSREVLQKMQALLLQVGKPLSPQALAGCPSALQADLASGTRIAALLVATGIASPEDLPGLRGEDRCAQSEELWLENGRMLNEALLTAGCTVLFSPAEWRSPPAPFPDTLIFQLFVIWDFCTSGEHAGLPRGRALNTQKEEALVHFAEFLLGRYRGFEEAFLQISQNKEDRLHRANFMSAMKQMEYDGDAKFVWHTLDAGTVTGFVTMQAWQRLGQEAQALMASRRVVGSCTPSPCGSPIDQEFSPPPPLLGLLPGLEDLLLPEAAKSVQPTTSIDAFVVLTDGSQRRVWVQTNVVEPAPPEGSRAASPTGGFSSCPGVEDTVLVLEVRERSEAAAQLRALVEVAQILDVGQPSRCPAPGGAAGPQLWAFSVAVRPGADLCGEDPGGRGASEGPCLWPDAPRSEEAGIGEPRPKAAAGGAPPRTALSMFHPGEEGRVLLEFRAGPAAALGREALRFFDELRILAFFTRAPE